jgi:hypothetical protein
MKAVFIPNLKCAYYILKKKKFLNNKHILCTNNLEVYSYFKDINNINCYNINSFLSKNEFNNNFNKCYEKFLLTLKKIDKDKDFKELFDLKFDFDWLFTLYKYKSLVTYAGLNFYKSSLKKFLKEKKIKTLIISQNFSEYELLKNEDFIILTKQITEELNIKSYLQSYGKNKNYILDFSLLKIFKDFLKYFIFLFNNQINKIKNKIFDINENIGIFEPLYEIKYLKFKNTSKFFIYHTFDEKIKKFFFNILNIFNAKNNINNKLFNKIKKNYNHDYIFTIVLNRIFLHFEKNIYFYQYSCIKMLKYLESNKIKKVYWGLPPVNPSLRLALISYLKKNKINVIGIQHGGYYGEMEIFDKIHMLTDYVNCDQFYSYDNYKYKSNKKIFSQKESCKIIKRGSYKKNYFNKNYFKKINEKKILYPITHWHSSFNGFPGVDNNYMYNLQKNILNILSNLKIDKIIKFSPIVYNKKDDGMYPGHILSQKYDNFIYEKDKSIVDSINFYKPDLIILDTISSPIHEVLNSNCQIICFYETIAGLKKTVKKKFSKRVNFVNTIKEFDLLINKYKKN